MNAPVVQNIQANNPLGAADTGVTKDAMDASSAGAGKYVQNYGDTLAKLSGYSAPLALVGRTATDINTNLMPSAVADALVKTGAPALLEPSTLAYQQDKGYASDVNTSNAMTTQGATGLATAKAEDATTLANLLQGDTTATIQSQLNLRQQQDAAAAGLGTGMSSLGNLGVQFAASRGGLQGAAKAIGM
jgi:hypothetical protein